MELMANMRTQSKGRTMLTGTAKLAVERSFDCAATYATASLAFARPLCSGCFLIRLGGSRRFVSLYWLC